MVVRKYLLDTNIFLEVLLQQSKHKDCIDFIANHFAEIAITQFSLNSIGVACNRNNSVYSFTSFLNDIASFIPILTLGIPHLLLIEQTIKNQNLDYDDSYQFIAAQKNDLIIVTLDKDFKKVQTLNKIVFL